MLDFLRHRKLNLYSLSFVFLAISFLYAIYIVKYTDLSGPELASSLVPELIGASLFFLAVEFSQTIHTKRQTAKLSEKFTNIVAEQMVFNILRLKNMIIGNPNHLGTYDEYFELCKHFCSKNLTAKNSDVNTQLIEQILKRLNSTSSYWSYMDDEHLQRFNDLIRYLDSFTGPYPENNLKLIARFNEEHIAETLVETIEYLRNQVAICMVSIFLIADYYNGFFDSDDLPEPIEYFSMPVFRNNKLIGRTTTKFGTGVENG